MSLYETCLTVFDLRDYIFYAPRTNLFNGNREGLFSSLGYLSILLISMSIGRQIFSTLYLTPEEEKKLIEEKKDLKEEQRKREVKLLLKLIMFQICIMIAGEVS